MELLKKSLDPNQNLTEEEYQQLEQMGDLTEYQKTALEIDTQLQVLEEKRQAESRSISLFAVSAMTNILSWLFLSSSIDSSIFCCPEEIDYKDSQ